MYLLLHIPLPGPDNVSSTSTTDVFGGYLWLIILLVAIAMLVAAIVLVAVACKKMKSYKPDNGALANQAFQREFSDVEVMF